MARTLDVYLHQNLAGHLVQTLPRRPLLAGDEDVRLSLAGAQYKVAVKVSGHHISIPLGGAPSTHILKPALLPHHFEKLAEEAGLAKPLVKKRVPELAAKVVEALRKVELKQPNGEKIADLIRERCEQTIRRFQKPIWSLCAVYRFN